MPDREFRLHDGKKGAALAIRVTPRARRNEVVEVLSDQTVKIRLTAPPVEGKANDALINYLSDILDIPKSKIEIVAGETGRDKLVSVLDADLTEIHQKILENIA
ncbi:MAG: DUF167 domain-containing protein [Chloroflexi bacterium]|nr:MAG: DUF167 domain-containing protein [Chloroflexota bacterium]MBL1195527.1 DUF167 domain-containing protein [Chloroflexota bacterium]NOH12809.1 DUF167 domain-containing protein [Chloroflexota bacterium]